MYAHMTQLICTTLAETLPRKCAQPPSHESRLNVPILTKTAKKALLTPSTISIKLMNLINLIENSSCVPNSRQACVIDLQKSSLEYRFGQRQPQEYQNWTNLNRIQCDLTSPCASPRYFSCSTEIFCFYATIFGASEILYSYVTIFVLGKSFVSPNLFCESEILCFYVTIFGASENLYIYVTILVRLELSVST